MAANIAEEENSTPNCSKIIVRETTLSNSSSGLFQSYEMEGRSVWQRDQEQ